jgi:hypothetical protein
VELHGDDVTIEVTMEDLQMEMFDSHNILCVDFAVGVMKCATKEKKVK